MEMKLSQMMCLDMDGAEEPEVEGPLLGGKVPGASTDCRRCHQDIHKGEGGVQIQPGHFICWTCEWPTEDLLDVAERNGMT
jgi:hypothetical protein